MKWTVANEAQFPQAPLMGFYAAGEIGPQVEEGAEHAFLRGNAAMQAIRMTTWAKVPASGKSCWKMLEESTMLLVGIVFTGMLADLMGVRATLDD